MPDEKTLREEAERARQEAERQRRERQLWEDQKRQENAKTQKTTDYLKEVAPGGKPKK